MASASRRKSLPTVSSAAATIVAALSLRLRGNRAATAPEAMRWSEGQKLRFCPSLQRPGRQFLARLNRARPERGYDSIRSCKKIATPDAVLQRQADYFLGGPLLIKL